MVARVDQVLVSELGLAEGLAHPDVYVLDPCCGTGSFLVAVLDRLAKRYADAGKGALVGQLVKQAAAERIFGFELMPAPFVVAHLQLGLVLQRLGAPLGDDERVGVYLTNALTGWEPPTGPKQKLMFSELEDERDQAERVKQATPILVVLGNPPYSGFAGIAIHEERSLTESYRTTVKAPRPQGQGLNDLYVRFFRMAERKITEQTGRGIVCYISNYSWLDGLSHTGMRERFLEAFDSIYIDNLHGDRIISEYAPDGKTSETVFAMQGMNAPGIRIGTAIAMLVRKLEHVAGETAAVHYHDQNESRAGVRRQALLDRAMQPTPPADYTTIAPSLPLGLIYKPRQVDADYLSWPLLVELFPTFFSPPKTSRDAFLTAIDRIPLELRIRDYYDPDISDSDLRLKYPEVMTQTNRYEPISTRRTLMPKGMNHGKIIRYYYRPFDNRWLYWEPDTKLLAEKSAEYVTATVEGTLQLIATQKSRKTGFYGALTARNIGSLHLIESGTIAFPLELQSLEKSLLSNSDIKENVSEKACHYARQMNLTTSCLFHSVLAIQSAPKYGLENDGPLRLDWPRIPLPATRELLEASAALGHQVAALLDTEAPVAGVTVSPTGPYVGLGQYSRTDNTTATDFALTVGWGHGGKGGITMPGKGRAIQRDYTPEERAALGGEAIACLGDTTFDIYLNDTAYWKNVPARVWTYTIGGYQVLKKWLSYRESKLLGRPLKLDEVQYVQEVVRRLAALCLLEPALDANYLAIKSHTYPWPRD